MLQDSYTGLYESQEAAQNDVEQYRTWQLQEGDEVIGETATMVLQPQVSFVLMDQYTGEVKAISGGRGEKTASRTLNRASDVVRQPGIGVQGHHLLCPGIDTCGATLGTVYYDAPYTVDTRPPQLVLLRPRLPGIFQHPEGHHLLHEHRGRALHDGDVTRSWALSTRKIWASPAWWTRM